MSVVYGLLIFLISVVFVGGLVALGRDYILFPAFAGFMVIGPILAVGLYEKSRRIETGKPLRWRNLFFVRPRSGGQILFTGVLLCLLMMVWMRAAVIIYALFFGLQCSRLVRLSAVYSLHSPSRSARFRSRCCSMSRPTR
jgi:uncharacterized membrane protein